MKKIHLFFKSQSQISEVAPAEFAKYFSVEWQPSLAFQDARLQTKIQKKCYRADRRGEFTIKQKWLGTHLSDKILTGYSSELFIAWVSDTIQYGVFAKKRIEAGSYIGEYGGVVRKGNKEDADNEYCFEYAIGDRGKSPYLIDAKDQGGYTRFINHSASPNLEHLSVYSSGQIHIIFIASQTINEGEELRYNYGEPFWKHHRLGSPVEERATNWIHSAH